LAHESSTKIECGKVADDFLAGIEEES